MATHSSILAWRIPGIGEPGGLPSMGSHRVRHNLSDLAAAAAHIFINQNRNNYLSAHFCQWEMFVYSYSIKIHALGFDKLLESIFYLLLVLEAFFPAKSCQDAWRSGSRLARGQVNMADEAKLCSPVHSTSEALVVWCHDLSILNVEF